MEFLNFWLQAFKAKLLFIIVDAKIKFNIWDLSNRYVTQTHRRRTIQGLVKGEKFSFRNLDFYFQHGESTSTASQLIFQASPKKSGYKQSFASFKRPWV